MAPVRLPGRPRGWRRRAPLAAGALTMAGAFLLLPAFRTGETGIDETADARTIEITVWPGWYEVRYLADSPHRMAITANELHLPRGERIRFRIESTEVIRSFRIRNLSGRVTLAPGREAVLDVTPRQTGVYRGRCTRFCTSRQARMQLTVVVREPADFEAWLENQRQLARPPADALAQRGFDAFMGSTCATCHRIRGTDAFGTFGPDLTRVATRRTLAAGAIPNDQAHLAAFLVDPHNFKPSSLMPPTHLSPDALHGLIHYLESLR